MKTVHELNQDELNELRGNFFEQLKETNQDVLGSIEHEDEIPMENVIEHYEGTSFVDDDFFCNI